MFKLPHFFMAIYTDQYQFPDDDSEVVVEEIEYDRQGRVVKRTVTTTRARRPYRPWWESGPTSTTYGL